MKDIYIITDYKGRFESKYGASPYRSGLALSHLTDQFSKLGFKINLLKFSSSLLNLDWNGKYVLYTSQEDDNLLYKSYIDDIIYAIKMSGGILLPSYEFFKAHENKVFMELLLRKILDKKDINLLESRVYGCYEELIIDNNKQQLPAVFKQASGSMSKNVGLLKDYTEIKGIQRKLNYKNTKFALKEYLRTIKHKHYIKESFYREKFVVQQFVKDLKSDFKVLIFYNKYFIFERPVRENDFRASGSGNINYNYGSKVLEDLNILNFCEKAFNYFNIPMLSLDIVKSSKDYFIIEFQAIYFGKVGAVKSDVYYQKNEDNNSWDSYENKGDLEYLYAYAIASYINKNENIIH